MQVLNGEGQYNGGIALFRVFLMDVMQYAWFVVILIGIVLSTVSKAVRQHKLVETGVAHAHINRIHVQVTVAMAVTAGLVGTNQAYAQIQNPFYVYSQNIDNIHVLIGKAVLALFWLTFLVWVWASKNFQIYVRLILPNALKRLEFLSKPVATLCVIAGMGTLALYPGNRLPVLVTNGSDQKVEWIQVAANGDFDGAQQDLKSIAPNSKKVQNIRLDSDTQYMLKFKLAETDKPLQARVPFEISEFSMGLIHVAFDDEMRLRIFDRRVFK